MSRRCWLSVTRLVAVVVLAGTPLVAHAQQLEIAIERRLAQASKLVVGDTVRVATDAGRRTLARVAAIYEPAPDPATIMRRDYHVRLHLPDLSALLDQPDRVDRFAVALHPGVAPDTAAARLNRVASGFEVYPSLEIAAGSSSTFQVVSRFHRAIAIISILASAVFLLCLMLLKVEERRIDVAVLRFTGISRRTVFLSLMLESAAIAVIGSALGVGIAIVASAMTNWHYQRIFDTPLLFSVLTLPTVGFAVVLSVVLGVAVGALAAWRLVRTPPISLWRRAT